MTSTIEGETDTTWNEVLERTIFRLFGWPNQPSSGKMKIFIGHVLIYSEKYIWVITEIRKPLNRLTM